MQIHLQLKQHTNFKNRLLSNIDEHISLCANVVNYEAFLFKNLYVHVFHREETLYSVQCILMVYNDSSKQWMTCGNAPYVSNVYILHNVVDDSYRFVGISEQDREACSFCVY